MVHYFFSITLLTLSFLSLSCMEPLHINGKYYYPENNDINYNHLSPLRALPFIKKEFNKFSEWIGTLIDPQKKPEKIDIAKCLNPTQSIPECTPEKPTITWVGHSTFLIQIDGYNILTDPLFGNMTIGHITAKRNMKPGIILDDLPEIHAILISHDHHDHFDPDSLTALAKKFDPIVYAPLGNEKLLKSMGFSNVVTCTWWDKESLSIHELPLEITCLPAYHWSGRNLTSYRKSLWSGWMISTKEKNIYFAGDTAYGSHFTQISEAFPEIDLALMPIGPTDKEGRPNLHKREHVDAPEAVQAFIDLNAKEFIPMHYGTFRLIPEIVTIPVERLIKTWQEKEALLQNKSLCIIRCGEPIVLT